MVCTLLCAASIVAYGGAGVRLPEAPGDMYGHKLGEFSMQIRSDGGLLLEGYHLSGLNADEVDGGMNLALVGYAARHPNGLYASISGGMDLAPHYWSNQYSRWQYHAVAGFRFPSGVYFSAVRLRGTGYLAVGLTAQLF